MRLTLRTMLAYLDDILEPDDSQDIGRKIEESEFATSLVHRMRECMRRPQLGAPPVLGRGLAADPNTVAEYLDNTLAAERVPELEKICLESDVHLAEVASSHQILTLVLGEPAQVDQASRQLMYDIARRGDAAQAPAVDVDARPAAAAARPPELRIAPKRPRPEVPEYLRETRPRGWPVAATIAVAAIVTLLGLVMFGPRDVRQRIAHWISDSGPDETQQGKNSSPDEPRPSEPREASRPPAKQNPAKQDPTERQESPAAVAGSTTDPANPEGTPSTDADAGTDGTGDVQVPLDPGVSPTAAGRGPSPPVAAPDLQQPGITKKVAVADPKAAPAGGALPGNEPSGAEPGVNGEGTLEITGQQQTSVTVVDPKGTGAPDPASGEAVSPPAPVEVGRYISDRDVLLSFDSESAAWRRIPSRALLITGERLLSLPLFRSKIGLSSGLTIELVGPTRINVDGADAQGVPIVTVHYGRLLIMPVGRSDNRLQLRFGDRGGLLTFTDADSVAGVEVGQVLVSGRDPSEHQAPLAVELYVSSGSITWNDAVTTSLQAPSHKVLTQQKLAPLERGELPLWLTGEVRNALDASAAAKLDELMPLERPASLSLKERTQHQRVEVRSLAIRSCGYIGQYDPLVSALGDETQKTERGWPAHIDALRAALARSREDAKAVHETLVRHHGEDKGYALYHMLWSFTPDELSGGAAAKLVDHLQHDELAFRVLAIWNLQRISGKSLGYRPEYPPIRNRSAIQTWRERLAAGKIVPAGAAAGNTEH